MSKRYVGGMISSTPTIVDNISATGIFNVPQQYQYKQLSSWPNQIPINYLVIGGGGGGGANQGGGGGGGGMVYSSSPIAAQGQSYKIVVGAGGAGSNATTTRATNGANSLMIPLRNTASNYMAFFGGQQYTNTVKDYITTPASSIYAMDSGNFTIEGWMYVTGGGAQTSTGNWRTIVSTRANNSTSLTTNFSCGVGLEGGIYFYSSGMSVYVNTSLNFENRWCHFAFVKNGTTMTAYINGSSVATGSNTDNYTGNQMAIAGNLDGSESWEGYLSNLRVTKGVAVYTGNFTVSTVPVKLNPSQPAGTNINAITASQCSLLTFASAALIDLSPNYSIFTINGNTSMVAYSYTPTVIYGLGGGAGGSGYFSKFGSDGGSGGGGANGGTPGLGRSGMGRNGGSGTAYDLSPWSAAGGGGAGAVGQDVVSNSQAGNGGAGLQNSITGTATYYSGGGGGYGGSGKGTGGVGGGGAGTGSFGTANTGGGGGGGGSSGGLGGSGIVIISYPDTFPAAATTGTVTITSITGYRIYAFTSSGTITF